MKIYKYKNLFVLVAFLGWVSFACSAFLGFRFWYLGFVVFLWLCLAILNYRHETTLWLLRHSKSRFLKYYTFLLLLGFLGDYFIGQNLLNLWEYGVYSSIWDWARLYFLIYPIAGLSLVEFIYFLSSIFGEKITLIRQSIQDTKFYKLKRVLDATMILVVLFILIFRETFSLLEIQTIFLIPAFAWMVLTTFGLKYYLRHLSYWVAIIVTVTILSILLHEIPNTFVYEWTYYSLSFFNLNILNIPLWVLGGWYFMVLIMLKYWIKIVLLNHRN